MLQCFAQVTNLTLPALLLSSLVPLALTGANTAIQMMALSLIMVADLVGKAERVLWALMPLYEQRKWIY